MDRNGTWYDFGLLNFVNTCFLAHNMIYPGEYSMFIWEECVFWCCWNRLFCIYSLGLFDLQCYSCLLFLYWLCLDDLSIDESGVLKFLYFIVLLSISLFTFINICFIYFCSSVQCRYICSCYILLMYWPICHYTMTPFVPFF